MLLRHPILFISMLAAVLFTLGAGVFIYDQSRTDLIARGVSIGNVDVGGMRAADARALVASRLVTPLQQPLVVHVGLVSYPLTAREAQIRADVDGMVAAALTRSREGSFMQRTWRALSGEHVHARIAPQILYSHAAVQRLVDRIRIQNTHAAANAKVDFTTTNLKVEPARDGSTIDARQLKAEIQAALLSPVGSRQLVAQVTPLAPAVPTDKVATRYPVVLTVDRHTHRLRLFKDLSVAQTYPIALGRAGLETPAGLYKIHDKAVDPAWHVPNSAWAGSLAGQVIPGGAPNNPIVARWLGVADGIGVHGTADRASIGHNASHGCIRMLVEDVKVLYNEVPVGTPIFIS